MANSFIPTRDADFDMWANTFVDTVKANADNYGLTPDEIKDLEGGVAGWDTKFSDMFAKREAAKAATVGKDEMRKSFEETLRNISRQIQADPNVSNEMKADAGLPIHSTSRTPVTAPDSAPTAEIDACNIQEHQLKFFDTNNTFRRSRPRGVFGVEIFRFVGNEAPLSDEQYQMVGTVTRMNATVTFGSQQAGQTAWYRFRYINTRGEVGPWSMVYNATVMK